MTEMENNVLDLLKKRKDLLIKQVMEKFNISWGYARKILKRLEERGKVNCKKIGNTNHYSLSQPELKNFLPKDFTDKVVKSVFPLIKKKVLAEFEPTVQHEIKIGTAKPVKIKGNLPPCFDSILAYAANGNPVMMTGPAGTGKGFLARQVALATGSKFFEVNAVKNSYDLTGFVDANSKFVRTPFYDACKTVAEGGKAVFLFDEMDCSEPEVLKIFNEALSSFEFTFPNDEHITFDNLIMLCACNTYGTGADEMYCGQQLDASTLDRFVMIRVDYDRNVEMQIADGDEELVEFIDEFRKQTEKNGMMFVASYRSIKRIASMRGILPLWQVMRQCFIKSMADDDLENILSNMGMTQNTYYRACTGAHVNYPEIRQQKVLAA